MRIKRMSSTVESEADLLLSAMKVSNTDGAKRIRYNNIPFAANTKFIGRENALGAIDKSLEPEIAAPSLNSIALFGMGGVSKTQIAIAIAYCNLEKFTVIPWVAADNPIAIGETCHKIADGLGLLGSDDEIKDAAAAIYQVKKWLATTNGMAEHHGSLLLTMRDFTVATSLVNKHLLVDALGDEDGRKMLLKALNLDHTSPDHAQHAFAISKTFGGLPLALTQIGGFIKQRKMSLKEFLPLYERYSAKIDARKAPGSDYEHTLSMKLTETSTRLLNSLSFLTPMNIDDEFSFLSEELDVGDASEDLLRAALDNWSGDLAILSIHRLVQSAVQKRLSESESIKYFDGVVHILCWGFPDHPSTDIGHQIAARTYLYEREMCIVARGMVEQTIPTFEDKTSLGYASAIDLGGLIDLDLAPLNNVALAYTEISKMDLTFTAHQEAIRLRLQANSNRIGNSYSNMSSLLLRMGCPDEAEEMLSRCPSLKDLTDEAFLSTGNPRFSGDVLLGNRLKTYDSQYDVASKLLKEGHASSATQLLEEIVGISETFVEGDGQRARALFKLTEVSADRGMQAESIASALRPELKNVPFEEAEFTKLRLWMLW
ncbi:P-loop containing nucleoside triphosphate hydrolase protein [Mariannaea sp. PMI_226]|nr:P-loop containing nucleoside triphosphate hydrolase protein [Mariannaea sp. PMI_226]